MKLLFIEDSEHLQKYTGKALQRQGYTLDQARDGEEGLWLARQNDYDAIILDIMLPKLDGLTVLQKLRAEGCNTHVLMLTARDTLADRVTGLRMGADDYLVKPFELEELLARVEALVRRAYGSKSPVITLGDLALDTMARLVKVNGRPVELAQREYSLLMLLLMQPGRVVSRTEIEQRLYGEEAEHFSNVVDSSICLLRRKIDQPGARSHIRTRRGMGYVFEPVPAPLS
ncbi:MAG: response regulator transcription factor [Chthoniobacteraceae bacterium]